MKPVFILLIRAYKYLISPLLPPSCRFYPSCSDYAVEAIDRHGTMRGGYYGARRLLKCHPYHPGGVDPVPGAYMKQIKQIKQTEQEKRDDKKNLLKEGYL